MIAQTFSNYFDQDEFFSEQPLSKLSERELLKIHKGLFKVADIEKVLKLPAGALRNAATRYERQGGHPYRDWGIGNSPISHWVVRMRIFSKAWLGEIKPQLLQAPEGIKHLPADITTDKLITLHGIYRLSQLKGMLPFSHQSVKNQARKCGPNSRAKMGCWKEGSQFYVDMQPFLRWVAKNRYS